MGFFFSQILFATAYYLLPNFRHVYIFLANAVGGLSTSVNLENLRIDTCEASSKLHNSGEDQKVSEKTEHAASTLRYSN